jgi:tRNA uridine 5-carboxymethylaminomethyl modification enzyme
MAVFEYPEKFDVIVVGGGHAGIEASRISAIMGKKTLLITQSLDTIGQMSCNPSIGGVGKGQIVREIDALGGAMGIITDQSAIHYHMLNTSRGPAVHSPRAQCDKKLYHIYAKKILEETQNLYIIQDEAKEIITSDNSIEGLISIRNIFYKSKIIILTTGTFLNGVIHIGEFSREGGRYNDPPAKYLSDSLRKLGLKIKRLKTGTPMRLNGRYINFELCTKQPSDNHPFPFSIFSDRNELLKRKYLDCWITRTTEKTFDIINSNLNKSALYSGRIKTIGPRYCPSIEDKIYKFPHHKTHHIFLEPEGFNTLEYYVNGLSTSLREDVQIEIVKSIDSIKNAPIIRPGYAIEYDLSDPLDISYTLESKIVPGLFLAGQINGTTGYEEAAGQGLVAGINAALKLDGKEPFILKREESYIGVMIDDLITKGVDEPYRIFTSRAEFRILLRYDNADLRLTDYAFKLKTLPQELKEKFERYKEIYNELLENPDKEVKNYDIYPWSIDMARQSAKNQRFYSVYIDRYKKEAEKIKKFEEIKIPDDIDYNQINELSIEARQKLSRVKPKTLAQAYRISGITISDVQLIWILIEKRKYERKVENSDK